MSTPQRVLIVDDEPEVRSHACRAFAENGFECDQAGDGEEALLKVNKKTYDAVVTDLRMPMLYGHALCNDLLKMPSPPNVFVLTALSDARLVRDLMTRGVKDVIQKPVEYDLLAMKVANLIPSQPAAASPPPKTPPLQPKRATAKFGLLETIERSLVDLTELFEERLDEVFQDIEELPEPPSAVRDCIRRLAEHESGIITEEIIPGHESRRSERVTCYTNVIAVPVDRNWRRCCEPFQLALRDLSESGLRLLHTRATNASFLALCWNASRVPSAQIRVVAKVMRVKPCSPFYDIGGQFVLAD